MEPTFGTKRHDGPGMARTTQDAGQVDHEWAHQVAPGAYEKLRLPADSQGTTCEDERPRETEGGQQVIGACCIAIAVDLEPMRVFGIDCGTEITGFGVVESDDSARQPRLVCMAKGAIRLAKTKNTSQRLKQVFTELTAEMERWQPEVVAIEEVFYSVNAKSALKLGQVRGVALLAAACQGLPVADYAPLKIKSSV